MPEAATPTWDAVPQFRPQGCRVERSHSHGRGAGGDQERLPRGGSARDEHRAGTDSRRHSKRRVKSEQRRGGGKVWDKPRTQWESQRASEETSFRKSQIPAEWMFLFFHGHIAVKKNLTAGFAQS